MRPNRYTADLRTVEETRDDENRRVVAGMVEMMKGDEGERDGAGKQWLRGIEENARKEGGEAGE